MLTMKVPRRNKSEKVTIVLSPPQFREDRLPYRFAYLVLYNIPTDFARAHKLFEVEKAKDDYVQFVKWFIQSPVFLK